jgi:hypothetical protein
MADGLHAVVFVDNHDNQRGHGGGGGVLTASSKIIFIILLKFQLQKNAN